MRLGLPAPETLLDPAVVAAHRETLIDLVDRHLAVIADDRRPPLARRVVVGGSLAVMGAGAYWFVECIFHP